MADLATELFETYRKYDAAHDRFFDMCLEILGVSLEECPFEDITHDAYDSSFELKECSNGLELTAEQQQKFWELGFQRCWLCWRDGTEKRYGKPYVKSEVAA